MPCCQTLSSAAVHTCTMHVSYVQFRAIRLALRQIRGMRRLPGPWREQSRGKRLGVPPHECSDLALHIDNCTEACKKRCQLLNAFSACIDLHIQGPDKHVRKVEVSVEERRQQPPGQRTCWQCTTVYSMERLVLSQDLIDFCTRWSGSLFFST